MRTLVGDLNRSLDEAETEINKDVDQLVQRIQLEKGDQGQNQTDKEGQAGDKSGTDGIKQKSNTELVTHCSNGMVISGLPKPSSKYQNMRLRMVDQRTSEIYAKFQHYATTMPGFIENMSKMEFKIWKPAPKKKGPPKAGEKREVPSIANINFKRLFEIVGLNQE
jgi:hypothetical protein